MLLIMLLLKALSQDVGDVAGLAHGVEMDCRSSVPYEVLALLCAPFCSYLIDGVLVIPESGHFLGQFERDVE